MGSNYTANLERNGTKKEKLATLHALRASSQYIYSMVMDDNKGFEQVMMIASEAAENRKKALGSDWYGCKVGDEQVWVLQVKRTFTCFKKILYLSARR